MFDIDASTSLTREQRERLRRRFGGRVSAVAQDARSQARNRELALERLRDRVAGALARRKPRRSTRPSRSAKERRLAEKRRRGERKEQRRPPSIDE